MAKVTVDTIRNIKGASLERAPKKHTSSSSVTHGGGGVRRDNTLGSNTSSSGSPYRGPTNIPQNGGGTIIVLLVVVVDLRAVRLEAIHIPPEGMLMLMDCISPYMVNSCHSSRRHNSNYLIS